MRLCLCILLAVGCATVKAQFDDEFEDFWNNDYDSLYDSDTFAEPAEKNDSKDKAVDTLDNDNKVIDEIETFKEGNDSAEEKDELGDYQFEDNRSKDKEDLEKSVGESKDNDLNDDIERFEDVESVPETGNEQEEHAEDKNDEESEGVGEILEGAQDNSEDVDKNDAEEIADDYALLWGDAQEEEALNKIKENELKVLDETEAILEEEAIENSDFDESNDEIKDNIDDSILQETKDILEDTNNEFDADKHQDEEKIQSEELGNEDAEKQSENEESEQGDIEEPKNDVDESIGQDTSNEADSVVQKEPPSEEDTVEKAYADLNADLDQLFDTLDKLTDDDDKQKVEEPVEEKELDEDEFDEQRFHDALNMSPLDYEEKYGVPYRESLTLQMRNDDVFDDYEELDDDIESLKDEEINSEDLFNDKEKTAEKEPVIYAQDAFVDKEQAPIKETEASDENDDKVLDDKDSETKEQATTAKVDVDELTSSEISDLMGQFTALHRVELDTESEDFDKHIAPVHITLSVDEPIIVTSPNYPNPYTTNNIIDWVFQGEGVGIELNITDFAVNGALGDYLLIKPGGIDASGQEGLVFSYRLNSERRYRFMDVDRMFVRFESKLGMAFFRGFQFSVKMISPLPQEPEPIPDPEPVLTPPTETLTLSLGGITLLQFNSIKEEFRVLIADMATEYIAYNNIDQGLNTTFEITQITRTALCNINWPESENCAKVTFGVPLTRDEDEDPRLTAEDLENMWRTYIRRDPFALRLQRLGITEFAIPDERSVLAVWLVIAAGVFIAVAMLGFALWRFSCFENYTRMKAYSDTDSVHNEKRNLDLYPTPHQTLPPLYADTEYKWVEDDSTRVDMGGFAHKSYSRELYDFDSDEDVIIPRDRSATDV